MDFNIVAASGTGTPVIDKAKNYRHDNNSLNSMDTSRVFNENAPLIKVSKLPDMSTGNVEIGEDLSKKLKNIKGFENYEPHQEGFDKR